MKTKDILPKEKFEKLYLIEKKSYSQIAKEYNFTIGQVHRLKKDYNLRTIEQYERHPISEFTEREKSIILGKILGDGHIRNGRGKKAYPQLMIEHSIKQKDYVYWLKEELNNWIYNKNLPIKTNRKKHKNGKFYHSLSFQTICHPVFNEIYKAFYRDGRKILGIEYMKENFTLLSFAVWLMDDGFLSGKCRRNGLSTNNFTLEEVKFLSDFLKERFELKSWVCRRTSTRTISWELAFDKKSSILISEMLSDLVIDSLKYKLLSETTKDAG